jgi:hypothetical protein
MSPDRERFTPFTGVPVDARSLFPSPDGKTIAYLRDVNGSVELWAMDRDGANRRAVLPGTFFVESAAWSPDGKKIAIAYSTETISNNIATINSDGTGFVDLTPDPLPGIWIDRDPAWSPDGTRIAFSSNRSGGTRVWVMNADGSGAFQVVSASVSGIQRQPVWAPDTTNFIAAVGSGPSGTGIVFVKVDGSEYKHIPITPGPNDPVWLPDGRLAYVANPTGDYDVWTVDRVSGSTTQLTNRRDDDVKAVVLTDVAPYTWLGFAAPATYQINRPFVTDIAVADVLTDGRPDVLVLSPIFNEVRLMRGTPTGNLQAVGALFAEDDVQSLLTGIITNDLAPDIVGRADSAAYLWRGRADGPGIATRIFMNGELRGLALADLDGDGHSDIISVVENTGQPFRVKTHTIGGNDAIVFAVDMATTRTGARGLCAGDMNNDGRLDAAIFAGSTALGAFLLAGRGELGVDDPIAAGTSLSTDLEAVPYCADFNNDGRDDALLFSPGATQSVAVHRFGTSSFGAASRISASATSVAIADIDRDGDLDVILASTSTAAILVAKNRGGGTFDAPVSYTIANTPVAVEAADINGDSWPDIIATDATGALAVLLSRGRTGM